MKTRNIVAAATTALAVLTAPAVTAQASEADVANFYRGKTITMYIGYTAGGGYDVYARLIAQHMTRHIPGNPNAISKNYTGAGGIRVLNALYNVFPQDGTNMAIVGRNVVMASLFGNKQAKFDAEKFQWLGSANQEYSVCVFWAGSKITSIQDALSKTPAMGGLAVGSTIDVHTLLVNNLLGGKFRLITGYPGGADITLALERGEVDGRCGWSWSSIKTTAADWIRDKKINITLQYAMKKHPELPNVPLISDLVTDKKMSDALYVHLSSQVYGRPFATGPKVPRERYMALRNAFWKTMTDPAFLAEANKRKLEIDPASGEEVQKLIDRVYALPKETIDLANRIGTTKGTKVSQAVIPILSYSGSITGLKNDGRRVSWKGNTGKGRLRVSGSGTKITVAGQKAKRGALKVGMSCDFRVKGAETALNIDCK